ncbi:MAG: stage II sporulation protein D [Eubacteriales bacterium]
MRECEKLLPSHLANGAIFGVVAMLVLFILPTFLTEKTQTTIEQEILLPTTSVPEPDPIHVSPSPIVGEDEQNLVDLLLENGEVVSMSMAEYLWGVVAAEMPASFELEALKSQAVAARTYTAYRFEHPKHENADICTFSGCCQAYVDRDEQRSIWGDNAEFYTEKISQSITETDGLHVLYQESPIDAVFFSSTDGNTLDSVEVWGSPVGYLVSVTSPEGSEVPNYTTTVKFTVEEVESKLTQSYPQVNLEDPPEVWFRYTTHDTGGGVAQINVGGISLTGNQIRALFGLRSSFFELELHGEEFLFTVTGYGHGVGMSQYGANAMAKEGDLFDQILTWYYTDTEVAGLY